MEFRLDRRALTTTMFAEEARTNRPTEENGRRVLAAISEFGFPTTRLNEADIVGGTKVIKMGGAGPAQEAGAWHHELHDPVGVL